MASSSGGGGGGGEPEADAVSLRGGTTSQPFVKILEMIRGSASGSVFERRLESQVFSFYRVFSREIFACDILILNLFGVAKFR